MWTRRDAIRLAAVSPLSSGALSAATWNREWDRAVLSAAIESMDKIYDSPEHMVTRKVGPQYQYHTNLRSTVAHPTRQSLEYALYLLEAGNKERAEQILDRVLALQVTDRLSRWYGIWGWYVEEPPEKMSPADWNWADFNGATLLLIEHRHGGKLPQALRERVRESIRHAAYSVKRRNVSMGYTNIAVKGTFVTLAAAELLEYEDLREYAAERLYHLARHIDETGSFTEYNSPTYARVTIADLTRMGMLIRSLEMRELIDRIHDRAWLHLARHWHPPTRQLSGPMSRCYRTDIGSPLWLQKALGGRIEWATLAEIRSGPVLDGGETAVLELKCPSELTRSFQELGEARQHRELFRNAEPPEAPLQGTTWLAPEFTLGSASKSDFWVQRRPLLGYWGGSERPTRYLRLRLLKDDYDFSSGLFYSVQHNNCVLGFVNFRSPGGDRHVSLDPVENGAFECSRLRIRCDLAGVPDPARMIIDGKRATLPATDLPPASRVALDLGAAYLWIRFQRTQFGESKPRLSVGREEDVLTVSLDLHRSDRPETIRWPEVGQAWSVVSLVMATAEGSLEEFSLKCALGHFETRPARSKVRAIWRSPTGRLWLDGATGIGTVKEQNRHFRAGIRSGPVPVERLSEQKLVAEQPA